MVDLKMLELYRDLQISINEFDKTTYSFAPPEYYWSVEICKEHVINLLEKYKKKDITHAEVVSWANFILFSEWYRYCEKYQDRIAYILDKLEEIDEQGKELTPKKVEIFISFLKGEFDFEDLKQISNIQ
ncbi:hypothetical protein [Methanomethylovorans sp.]|uniref:hypothetical protein n=1 Tax=Methanomethylovorans sp. TaxID=2758717 RepID=UPI00351C8903